MSLLQNAALVRPKSCMPEPKVSRWGTRGRAMNRISTRLSVDTRSAQLYAPIPKGGLASSATCRSKRALDILVAGSALLALAPLLLLIALAIRLSSRGPVLFRQSRTGLGGVPFSIVKFRTMSVLENGHSVVQAQRNDHRVTPLGAFLRQTSLDELPQLWNVLAGDMSLVGPRPHAIAHDIHYGGMLPTYAERYRAKPGMTGLAQCNGARGPTETVDKMARRVRLDLAYVERWSWEMEVKIIAKTIKVLVAGDDEAF
jgi:putative colanic acid biosysnthesis UDP-glucose lipid carrier transferase